MKTLKLIGIALLVLTLGAACSGNKENDADKTQSATVETSDDVHVYYFHNKRRGPTCNTVEAEAKKAVQELYDDEVPFSVYNIESDKGRQKAEEIGVSGQSLIIVGGDEKTDITGDGFMHAKSNPDKLKQIIKEKTDPLIQ
ncbi:MAG: nitrophenyl compound nitroreductase subunit ArsF family protein [Bacteroidota bacterium]